MPLSPEQEALCERVEKGEPEPGAAALIRQSPGDRRAMVRDDARGVGAAPVDAG